MTYRKAMIFGGLTLALLLVAVSATAQSNDAGGEEEAQADEATADQVARTVVETTGDPMEAEKIAFSFVVEVAGEEKVRRRHVWWPKAGKVEMTSGEETLVLEGLHDHDLSKLAKAPEEHAKTWKEVAPDLEPKKAAKAWGWFVNDSYWLLMPSKLFDPGVNRKLDENGRLVLTFGDVGLTPGDRYALTVDRERGVVTRWDFTLEGGREGAFEWTGYEQFGPLKLSTRRIAQGEGPKTVIWFDDVEVTTK